MAECDVVELPKWRGLLPARPGNETKSLDRPVSQLVDPRARSSKSAAFMPAAARAESRGWIIPGRLRAGGKDGVHIGQKRCLDDQVSGRLDRELFGA